MKDGLLFAMVLLSSLAPKADPNAQDDGIGAIEEIGSDIRGDITSVE